MQEEQPRWKEDCFCSLRCILSKRFLCQAHCTGLSLRFQAGHRLGQGKIFPGNIDHVLPVQAGVLEENTGPLPSAPQAEPRGGAILHLDFIGDAVGIQTPPGQAPWSVPSDETRKPYFALLFHSIGIGDQTKNHSIGAQSKEPVGHIIPSVLFSSFFL